MNIDLIENKIISSLEGELNPSEERELQQAIANDENIKAIWDHYSEMYQLMDGDMYELPQADLQCKFDKWIETEKKNDNKPKGGKIWNLFGFNNVLGIAAAALLLLTVWMTMDTGSNNITANNNFLASNTIVESPTERIKTIRVNHSASEGKDNSEMLQMLFNVLKDDSSSNVRLAAAETLGNHVESENVRVGLIKALENETDGFVKLAIIHALGKNLNDNVKQTFERLVLDDSQEKFVKDEAYIKLIQY